MDKLVMPIAGMLPEEMESSLSLSPAFRARQVFEWVSRGANSFDDMTNISRPLRLQLSNIAQVRTIAVNQTLTDEDGTVKEQLRLSDGAMVESVVMREQDRRTVCLSTQAGCACGCAFCMTGTLGLVRNLEAHEIVEQFLEAEAFIRRGRLDTNRSAERALNERSSGIDNVVLMGMGEPLLNLTAVRQALAVLTDPRGRALSLRRVTLSTCGIIEGIDDLAANGPHVRLAVSLTTADEDLRQTLMPMARKNPLSGLRRAIAQYAQSSNRRVTLEAVMLGGVNTGAESAKHMIDFAQGLGVNINLIPWNAVPSLSFTAPAPQEVRSFVDMLQAAGLNVTVRAHHGRSVSAACGQLGGSCSVMRS